jgi:hypothetical protein
VSTLQQLTRELELEEARVRQQICQSRNPHSELTVAKIAAEARKAVRTAARAEGVDVVAAENAAAAAAAASETQLTAEQEAAVVAKPVKSKKKLTRRTIGAAVEDPVRVRGVSWWPGMVLADDGRECDTRAWMGQWRTYLAKEKAAAGAEKKGVAASNGGWSIRPASARSMSTPSSKAKYSGNDVDARAQWRTSIAFGEKDAVAPGGAWEGRRYVCSVVSTGRDENATSAGRGH